MAISAVGSLASANGTALTTLSVTSTAAGQMIALATLIISTARTVSSVSGHGATWLFGTRLVTAAANVTIELWYGEVLTPGTSNVTVTYNSAITGIFAIYDARVFDGGYGARGIWTLDKVGQQDNAAATTCAFPTLVPSGVNELYVGHGYGDSVALSGTGGTAGYTMTVDGSDNLYIYNTAISASTSPVSGATSSQSSHSTGALFTARPPGGLFLPF